VPAAEDAASSLLGSHLRKGKQGRKGVCTSEFTAALSIVHELTLVRPRQEDLKSKASLGYTARPCLKKQNKKMVHFICIS
jgi:hypothetical protein